jgi:hypothetical protein
MRTIREKCGCVAERSTGRERWVELCAPCRAEADARHAEHAAFMRGLHAEEPPVSDAGESPTDSDRRQP